MFRRGTIKKMEALASTTLAGALHHVDPLARSKALFDALTEPFIVIKVDKPGNV